jgi:cell division septum initiation protein DivIVA
MTSVAPDTELLQGLDEEMRLAWIAYSDRLRELSGAEYERAEAESWDELQSELRRLEDQRESLVSVSPPSD